jgi:bacteriorhodopsin
MHGLCECFGSTVCCLLVALAVGGFVGLFVGRLIQFGKLIAWLVGMPLLVQALASGRCATSKHNV